MIADLPASLLVMLDIPAAIAQSPGPKSGPDWLTIIVGVATVFQAIFACIALLGLRDSRVSSKAATEGLALTRDTAQRQLRAYVSYKGGRHDPIVAGKVLCCEVQFQNYGVTPACQLLAFGTSVAVESIENFDYPPPPARVVEVASRTTLGASGATTLRAAGDEPLTDAAWALVQSGKLNVVVYGEVRYQDIFGVQRETPFRLYYRPSAQAQDGVMWLCSQGNIAT